jgi:glycosyltransferase involved in cell wall biosynthesis
MTKIKRICWVVPYTRGQAPSQRFRFEQYLDVLEKNGYEHHFFPFWDQKAWRILYKPGHYLGKFLGLLRGIFRRHMLLFTFWKYDLIFIHREFSPVGFPWPVWVLSRIFKKAMVFDFDDAIWIPNSSASNRWTEKFRSYGATAKLIRWAHVVSCGNAYLQGFAKNFNPHAKLNPTTIDTENHHNIISNPTEWPFIIGWTGTHSTISYLYDLAPVIFSLAEKYQIEWRIISDKDPGFTHPCVRFVPWNKKTEIQDLATFHVGVMPLQTDPWSEGKCGFKALQYMALGIPALVSPVGVNSKIVTHGVHGFQCETEEEWRKALETLIENRALLAEMQAQTRASIEERFSVRSNTQNMLDILSLAQHLAPLPSS